MAKINVEELPKAFDFKVNTMKTCLPSNGTDLSTPLAGSFEYCSYFVLVDANQQKIITFILNDAQTAARGVCVLTAQLIIDQKVQTIITPEINSATLNILQKAGIRIYLGTNGTLWENIDLFRDGRLVEVKIADLAKGVSKR
ncbi:MAG: NifB/NifX family molybdenum-iron cluster-binding protein [Promethearchaeota archaeon]